jgi:hypothetical protein
VYAGHLAFGLAMKARQPSAPTWGLLLGVGFLDVLFGPFVLLGIERVAITPGVSPGFDLLFIDWSHSLLMALVWSLVYAACFYRRGPAIAATLGFAVFSHFLLDLPMHPADLALYPHSAMHLGWGLWRLWPTGWWFFELAVIAACLGYYWFRSRRDRSFGYRAGAAAAVVLLLHVANSPWLAPH